jgi:hypothetical protein
MRRLSLLLGLVLALGVPRVPALGQGRDAEGWYVGIASGWYFPIQQWPTAYRLGGGGAYFVGKELASRWAIQDDVNMWLLSGSTRSTWDLKTGPTITWTPAESRVSPLFLAGIGLDVQTNYPARTSAGALMVPVGAGVLFRVNNRGKAFVEGMHYLLFRPVTTRDIPLLAGFRLGF